MENLPKKQIIQMGHKFFQRYSRKYFVHRTGNNSYCLVGEISSLLRKNIYFVI